VSKRRVLVAEADAGMLLTLGVDLPDHPQRRFADRRATVAMFRIRWMHGPRPTPYPRPSTRRESNNPYRFKAQ
jgi:hypothetical protein